MLYPGTYEHELVTTLREVLAHEQLPEPQPYKGTGSPTEDWSLRQKEFDRVDAFVKSIKNFIRLEATLLETKLQEERDQQQQLRNECMALQSRLSMVEFQYQELLRSNDKFMRACVCVKLNQEPNNPEAAFK